MAGDKIKLLIVGTEQVKRSRVKSTVLIFVDEDIIDETKSEKLLGFDMKDKLTWKEHLHGYNENEMMV